MDIIDIDGIIGKMPAIKSFDSLKLNAEVRDCMKEAIGQALVLASEKATISKAQKMPDGTWKVGVKRVDKQSILDIKLLIK